MLNNFLLGFPIVLYTTLLLCYPLIRTAVSSAYFILLCSASIFVLLVTELLLIDNIFLNGQVLSFSSGNSFGFGLPIPFSFGFQLNSLTLSFSILVLCIAFATNIYLLNYFKGEAKESQFAFWLNAFVLSMLVLVWSNNFFTLFLGWEGIGLTSFFLINFWSTRRATVKASFKAFTFNTISDLCLLFSISSFFSIFNTDEIDVVLYLTQIQEIDTETSLLATISLSVCAAAKSVQLGGHIWLPDSMEAPVPASALIHSATLVSAGIYLILRFNMLFVSLGLESILLTWGGLTAVIGGITAANQTDLKKLLAYSTMSHCGFLWGLATLGDSGSCILYLFLHGFFKAGTFFAAGNLVQIFGTQDIRWMRNINTATSDILVLILMSSNLCGLPLSIGYGYKSTMLHILSQNTISTFATACYILGMLTSLLYFFRLNHFWLFSFNKSVKNDILTLTTFNRQVRNLGFSQVNSIFAILFIFLCAFGFVQLWNVINTDFVLGQITKLFSLNNVAILKTTQVMHLTFYWLFTLLGALTFFMLTRRSSYTASHEMLFFITSSFLAGALWNLLVYVSIHYDRNGILNKL